MDPRVLDLLLKYEEAAQRGEPLAPEDLCKECPELLDEVNRCLGGLRAFPDLASARDARWQLKAQENDGGRTDSAVRADTSIKDPDKTRPPSFRSDDPFATVSFEETNSEVPGYEILDTLGAGGWGVVYKARHLKLDRLVALKMIKSAANASREELDRFCAEARAVAQLQHPNIVQIFEIGEHDGLPFFALEYVDGGTLKDRIDASPFAPMASARMVEVLARAMEVAHRRGIIHRDVKPSNILLDAGRQPKIADFGLAKRLASSDGSLTLGIVGTPNYMPPEQASGDRAQLGPASDIYTLGAILYELLTGRVPFRGSSWKDTLKQVIEREVVNPKVLEPTTPRDLATITLKCLEKDASKRYATALDLAEDLRRYQAGEPILARPASKLERAIKWARRKPAAAGLIGMSVAAAMLVTATSVGYALIKAEAAVTERKHAQEEQRLREKAEEALENEKLAHERAKGYLRAANGTVTLLTRIGNERLSSLPRTEKIREEFLKRAIKSYEPFLKVDAKDGDTVREQAKALLRVAALREELGDRAAAEESYKAALKLVDTLAESKNDTDFLSDFAIALHDYGNILHLRGDWTTGQKVFDKAVEIRQQLFDSSGSPLLQLLYGQTLHRRGVFRFSALGDLEGAESDFDKALMRLERLAEVKDGPPCLPDLAAVKDSYGLLKNHKGNFDAAERLIARAVEDWTRLVKDQPDVPEFRKGLAMAHVNLSKCYLNQRKTTEAEAQLEKAAAIIEELKRSWPAIIDYRELYAICANNLAKTHRAQRRLDDEIAARKVAIDQYEILAKDVGPRYWAEYWNQLALAYTDQGLAFADKKLTDQAEKDLRRAVEIGAALANEQSPRKDHLRTAIAGHTILAHFYHAQGRSQEATPLREEVARLEARLKALD